MNTENVQMDTEGWRYATFGSWTHHADMSPSLLALAGFYHLPEINCVQCYACNLRIADDAWRREQRPALIHEGRRPGCSHFSPQSTNVPLGSRNLTFQQGQPQQQPTSTPFENPCTPPSNHDSKQEPVFPGMSEPIDRMNTFTDYQQISEGQAKELAKAGFFYMKKTPRIRCHHCGYSMEKRFPLEDMKSLLEEHHRKSPHCLVAFKIIEQTTETATATNMTATHVFGSGVLLPQHQPRENQRTTLADTTGDDHLRYRIMSNVGQVLEASSGTELSSDSSDGDTEVAREPSFGTGVQENYEKCHTCLEPVLVMSQAVYCKTCHAQYHRACHDRGWIKAACQAATRKIRRHGGAERCQVAACGSATEPYLRTIDKERNCFAGGNRAPTSACQRHAIPTSSGDAKLRLAGATYCYPSSKQVHLTVLSNQNRDPQSLPNARSRADATQEVTFALPRPLSDRPRITDIGELQHVEATGETPVQPTAPPPPPPEGAVGGREGAPEGQGYTCTDSRPPDSIACCVDNGFTVTFCLGCLTRMNRTCAVCKEDLIGGLHLLAIQCSNIYCQRWYHQEALENHEAVTEAVADLVNWICPKCKEEKRILRFL